MKRLLLYIIMCVTSVLCAISGMAQISTERVMNIGRNALQFEDYVLSIQYFNQVIKLKPYWADPYYYRAVAKLSLDDLEGAEEDATACIERNPYFNNVFYLRGVVRQNRGNFAGAVADYKQGLEYTPANRNLFNNLAIAYVQDSNYVAADSVYTELLSYYPSYAPAYLTRSQFNLMRGDTIQARSDLDRVIELDKNIADAYHMRALIYIKAHQDYKAALEDMNMAVRLEPKRVDFYVNRALIRYYNDDLRGAMDDYDYVLMLDPVNTMTYYNRGLLRAQVGERNRAVEDFTQVIKRDPHNYHAILNRAILYDELGMYDEAIIDYDAVLEVYPDYAAGLFARSEAKRKNGNRKGGEQDFKKYMALTERIQVNPDAQREASEQAAENVRERKESDKNISKYDRLMVYDEDLAKAFEPKYESKVRGRIQDRNVQVSLQPIFLLSYYERPNELRSSNAFADELLHLNELGVFKHQLVITNAEELITSALVAEHFISAGKYTEEIENGVTHSPITYMARSIDLMLIQDYADALDDINRVIELSPNLMLAYFQRAALRYKKLEYSRAEAAINKSETATDESSSLGATPLSSAALRLEYQLIIQDLNRVLELSPRFVYAYYNRANIHFAADNIADAIEDYNQAIRLQPDFADAYFNRGLAYLKEGNDAQGREDLSRAGEMGIMAAYNLLKRMGE